MRRFTDLGTGVAVHAWQAAEPRRQALRALAPIAPLLTSRDYASRRRRRTTLRVSHRRRGRHDDAAAPRCCSTSGRSRRTSCTGATRPRSRSDVSLTLPIEGMPVVHDLVTRRARAVVTDYSRDAATGRVRVQRAADRRTDARRLQRGRRGSRSPIGAASRPRGSCRSAEIIARHQQQQRAQDALVANYIAPRADGAALPADRGRSRLRRRHREPLLRRGRRRRVGRAVVFGQRLEVGSRPAAVSAAAAGEGAVAAAAAPLRRRLSLSAGRHASASTASTATSCGSSRCGSDAVALPRHGLDRSRRPSRGSACRPCRAACPAPVVSNEETQHYAPVAIVGNRPVFLFSGLTARQIVLVAGRNLLVEKSVAFSDFRVNDPDFDASARVGARRATASCTARPIAGLRYYVKEEGRRVVSDRADASMPRRWPWA